MNFLKRKNQKNKPIIPFSEFSGGREKRLKPERKAVQSYFLTALILWGFFFGSLFFLLFFSSETTIVDITFFGNGRISATDLRGIVRMDLEGRHFRIFPKNNFFFLPEKKILSDIKDFSPVVRSVSVERSFPNRLAVRIDERSSVIVWRSMNGDFILDEDGVAQSHPNIHSVLDDPSTVILWDEEGRETTVGDAVIDASLDTFIPECMQKFESRFGKTMTPCRQ
jgi:cell division septal protein FtsQ